MVSGKIDLWRSIYICIQGLVVWGKLNISQCENIWALSDRYGYWTTLNGAIEIATIRKMKRIISIFCHTNNIDDKDDDYDVEKKALSAHWSVNIGFICWWFTWIVYRIRLRPFFVWIFIFRAYLLITGLDCYFICSVCFDWLVKSIRIDGSVF